jgi:phosphoglycolate phosphatase
MSPKTRKLLGHEGEILLDDLQLILFDKDGTLIDIHHYWSSMIKIRAQTIRDLWMAGDSRGLVLEQELIEAMGVDTGSGRMKPQGPVGIKPRPFIVNVVVEVLAQHGLKHSQQEVEELFGRVDRQTGENLAPLLKLLPGVAPFLEKCHNQRIKLAIVTTDITQRATLALKSLGLLPLFDHLIGGDAVSQPKPAGEPALKVLEATGISSESTAVIGDHPVDIKMGINSNISCNIGVLTGLSGRDDFNDLPCHIVASFSELDIING